MLRGIAILGTLASNIWIFTAGVGVGSAGITPVWLGELSQWLPNGKFLGLLTIMFGIGLEIQRQAALRHGVGWPGKYPIRAGILFLDGLLNYVFVVQFDVLRAYALTGLIVAFLLLTSQRMQWWLIGIFLTVHLGIMTATALGTMGVDLGKFEESELAPLALDKLEDLGSEMNDYSYWDSVREAVATMGYGFDFNSEFFTIVTMGIGLFLLGANLYRIGLFAPTHRALRYWLMGFGFLVALPLDYLLTFGDLAGGMFSSFARYGAASGVALGILALVAEFYQRRSPGVTGRHLAFIGKMALSCYLLQNIIGVVMERTLIARGIGRNVDSTLATYAAFVAIALLLVLFSRLWLRRFSRGPFELAWNWCYRKLARQ